MNSKFKIVTGPDNHTGVAIFQEDGYAVHISPNQHGKPSSIVVYPMDKLGCILVESPMFGPVSATLKNLCAARSFINYAIDMPRIVTDADSRKNVTENTRHLRLPLPSKC